MTLSNITHYNNATTKNRQLHRRWTLRQRQFWQSLSSRVRRYQTLRPQKYRRHQGNHRTRPAISQNLLCSGSPQHRKTTKIFYLRKWDMPCHRPWVLSWWRSKKNNQRQETQRRWAQDDHQANCRSIGLPSRHENRSQGHQTWKCDDEERCPQDRWFRKFKDRDEYRSKDSRRHSVLHGAWDLWRVEVRWESGCLVVGDLELRVVDWEEDLWGGARTSTASIKKGLSFWKYVQWNKERENERACANDAEKESSGKVNFEISIWCCWWPKPS